MMLTVELPDDVEDRLDALVKATGRSKTSLIADAVLEHIADLEDLYLAERELDEVRAVRSATVPLEDVMKQHGIQAEVTMAPMTRVLPDVMSAPETGEVLRRDVRPFVVTHKGESITVDLPGFYPAGEGDGVHVGADMSVVDEALRKLEERIGS